MEGRPVEIAGPVVPSAHVFPRRRQARTQPERLEQPVFVDGLVEGMVGIKLLTQRPFQQLDIPVGELSECGSDGGVAL